MTRRPSIRTAGNAIPLDSFRDTPPVASEDRSDKPRGFAGLMSWVSHVDLAQLHAHSDKVANDPDPSSGVQSIRVHQLGRWLGISAFILFIGWLALN
jgi:hypothetical protein